MSGEICKDLSLAGMSQIEDEFSAGLCQFGCSWLQITTEQDKKEHAESFFNLGQYLLEGLFETKVTIIFFYSITVSNKVPSADYLLISLFFLIVSLEPF